jgi:hypothetical protein
MKTCSSSAQKANSSPQQVLFRIYVEDRGEPGNKGLADVYCFQAWSISGLATDSQVVAARQALAQDGCQFIAHYTPGALPRSDALSAYSKVNLIINDCGGLHSGNHQIHPTTAATCP